MTADLVVRGEFGTASRTVPRERIRLFGTVVDQWELHVPDRSAADVPVNMLVLDSGQFAVLVLVTVDPVTRVLCDWLGLPVALAAHMLAADLMPVDNHDHARMVTRHLARAAVDGTLPITPRQADYARVWGTANRTLCALTGGAVRVATGAVGAGTG